VSPHVLREDDKLTQIAFTRLLVWLDDGIESHGERYLEMRRRLVSYFDRRCRPSADELADETLNRVARTLDEVGVIDTKPPARYCYVVAKFVLLEDLRRDRRHVPLDETRVPDGPRPGARIEPDDERADHERRLDCLDRCLEQLKPEQRELIVEYYADAKQKKIERRRELAKRLGITMNALAIRAWRIREGLMTCVETCGSAQAADGSAQGV
jgi:RNA polymerase sigma factor (sigma-70 family)